MKINKILIIEQETHIRTFLAQIFHCKNLEVLTVDTGKKGISLLKEEGIDLVLTNMNLPDLTGLAILQAIKETSPSTLAIVLADSANIENAVEAIHAGAFHYIAKPFSVDAMEAMIEKVNAHLEENHSANEFSEDTVKEVVAESPTMRKIMQDVQKIAESDANVMITGESGTGKEVIAYAIHHRSNRAHFPFIRVNCAAIPDTLIESELFGYEKGAFTGATSRKPGRFELATRGTLLLDEITEVPLLFQAKLLRAVQEQEFERVGGVRSIKVNIRILSTSNQDIHQVVKNKLLREDLFYRLNVIPIHLPPLRERPDDIIPLAEFFLKKLTLGQNPKSLSSRAKKKLLAHLWPGNVRELVNVMKRAIILNKGKEIHEDKIFLESTLTTAAISKGLTLQELEKQHIIETLALHDQDIAKAAEVLGITPRKLKSKMIAYQIIKPI